MSPGSERNRKHAIGVLCGRKHLHGCRSSTTVFGAVRHEHASVAIENNDLPAAVQALLTQFDLSEPTPVAAVIPTSECYFATRPINAGGGNASPRTLLRESLRSSAAKLDQLAIDVLNWRADRRSLVGIIAAPLERVEAVRQAVTETEHPLQRLEPVANALVYAAADREKSERRDRLVTRVFLSKENVLAVMCKGNRAIHWQSAVLPQGDEGTGIVSLVRSVEAAYSACGLERSPDTVAIYGRSSLQSLIDRQWLQENLPDDYRWLDGPSLSPEDIAEACADYCSLRDDSEFNFVRQEKPPVALRRIVPYKEIAIYLLAACCLAFVLFERSTNVQSEYLTLQSTAPSLALEDTHPKGERDRLNARAASLSNFLDKRVQWSSMLGQIIEKLPEGTRLTGIRGSAVMAQKRKRATKTVPTTLLLNAECMLDEAGQVPESVSRFVESVQQLESVTQHFDRVELSDLRRKTSQESGVTGAEFSIVLTTSSKLKS
ncbi:MAG: hypothetical protein AAFX06_07880 [Planctomycetota bacterium]